ncbi:MAG: hypothetical protein OXG10_02690 [Candidatus Dadabacteria bacterium]|nr:hypothetical protein [Candidatus Dadabacteria bacterium]
MKFRIYGIVLSLFFALGLVFSFSVDPSAGHDGTGIAAEDVIPTDEASVKAFLNHIIAFYNQSYIPSDSTEEQGRKVTVYGRQIREEGVYRNSENGMYSMGISERGIVTNHAGHHRLYGYKFDSGASGSAVASTIQALIKGLTNIDTPPRCEEYNTQNTQGRWACATKVDSPSGVVTVIAGLDHAENESAFVRPDCTSLNSLAEQNPNYTSAMEVNDKESLRKYVESVIDLGSKLVGQVGLELFREHSELFSKIAGGKATAEEVREARKLTSGKLFEKVACFGNEDPDNGPVVKHGEIYSFVMDTDADATVLVNALNPSLNGLDLQVTDPDPIDGANIAELIRDAVFDAQGNPKEKGEFVEYHWLKPGDDPIDNWFEDKVVPGNSRKISYVRAANLNTSGIGPDALYIVGSGIYPTDMMPDDMPDDMRTEDAVSDGGCTIAGENNMSQSALLNLFLVASVLFPVVFLRRRI